MTWMHIIENGLLIKMISQNFNFNQFKSEILDKPMKIKFRLAQVIGICEQFNLLFYLFSFRVIRSVCKALMK